MTSQRLGGWEAKITNLNLERVGNPWRLITEGVYGQGFTSHRLPTLSCATTEFKVKGHQDCIYTDESQLSLHYQPLQILVIKSKTDLSGEMITKPKAKTTLKRWVETYR